MRWKNATKKLPESNLKVLLHIKYVNEVGGHAIVIGSLYRDRDWCDSNGSRYNKSDVIVTHWRLLPK